MLKLTFSLAPAASVSSLLSSSAPSIINTTVNLPVLSPVLLAVAETVTVSPGLAKPGVTARLDSSNFAGLGESGAGVDDGDGVDVVDGAGVGFGVGDGVGVGVCVDVGIGGGGVSLLVLSEPYVTDPKLWDEGRKVVIFIHPIMGGMLISALISSPTTL